MLRLLEEGDRTRLVLRLWDSGFRLKSENGSPPIWLATVTREDLRQPLGIVSLTLTDKDANALRDLLARTLPALSHRRADPPQGDAQWDGVLMLPAGGG